METSFLRCLLRGEKGSERLPPTPTAVPRAFNVIDKIEVIQYGSTCDLRQPVAFEI